MTKREARRWFVLLSAQPALAKALKKLRAQPGFEIRLGVAVGHGYYLDPDAFWLPADPCAVIGVLARLSPYSEWQLDPDPNGRGVRAYACETEHLGYREGHGPTPIAAVLALAEDLYSGDAP